MKYKLFSPVIYINVWKQNCSLATKGHLPACPLESCCDCRMGNLPGDRCWGTTWAQPYPSSSPSFHLEGMVSSRGCGRARDQHPALVSGIRRWRQIYEIIEKAPGKVCSKSRLAVFITQPWFWGLWAWVGFTCSDGRFPSWLPLQGLIGICAGPASDKYLIPFLGVTFALEGRRLRQMWSRLTKSQRQGARWRQSWFSPEPTIIKWQKELISLPKQEETCAICQHRGCAGRQLQWAQKGTRQFPDRMPMSRHHQEEAGMPIIPFLQLLGAHKGHKLQGTRATWSWARSHGTFWHLPTPGWCCRCCPWVTPLSPGFQGQLCPSSCCSGFSHLGNTWMPALKGPSPSEELLGHLQWVYFLLCSCFSENLRKLCTQSTLWLKSDPNIANQVLSGNSSIKVVWAFLFQGIFVDVCLKMRLHGGLMHSFPPWLGIRQG